MPESFDYVSADPGSGGANLAGDTFTQSPNTLFLPACYLVFGPEGGPYTRVDSGDGYPVAVQGTVPVSGTFWQATQPVSGPLTNAELRATAVPVSGTVTTGGLTDAQLRANPVPVSATNLDIRDLDDATDSVTAVQGGAWSVTVSGTPTVSVSGSVAVTGTFWQATQPVSGPLTDVQLRATPVPVSGTVSTGGLTNTELRSTAVVVDGSGVTQPVSGTFWQATQPVSGTVAVSSVGGSVAVTGTFWQATQPVSGPLTNTELRSSDVPVSGTFWQATQPVSGPLTDAQLRATPVPVSGTVSTGGLTNTELRSAAVVVDGSGVTQPVSGTFWQATQPVSGPLTDVQLRATPVPVSGTVSTGGLTNTELRSAAVVVDGSGVTQPVSGTFWQATQPVSGTVAVSSVGGSVAVTGTFWQATQPVSGPLTDAQLRATPVPVSGTVATGGLTNTELRSTAVVVDGSGVTQPVSGTFWQATQPVSGTVTVQDGGGSITVDGTVAATQSGTWTVTGAGGTFPVTGTFWQATQPVSIANTVTVTGTVDTELPAAAALADATSNPTAPAVGAFLMGWNGTTWDRVDTVNTGQMKSTLYDASGNAIFPTPAALSDTLSNPTTVLLGSCELLWDPANSQWDRRQAHDARNLIPSASYNPGAGGSTSSSTQTGKTNKWAFVQLTPSSAGTGTLTLRLNGRASSSNWVVLAQIALSTLVVKTIMFGPGCAGTGTGGTTGVDCFVSGILPKFWYVDVVHSAASAWSYLVDVDTF